MKSSKILPAAIFIGVLVILSQFARTSTPTEQISRASDAQNQNQFRLKQSFVLNTPKQSLLATIYSCGSGVRSKEVLSIWSRELDAYELQYIRTAGSGESFLEPELFSVEGMNFLKVVTAGKAQPTPFIKAVLSLRPDSTLHEIQTKQVKELIRIQSQS